MATTPRVLSIQSHVVSGYVGNKSATFPLQLLGFEVDAVNSVQFSNHTGYAAIKGQVLTEKDLDDLVNGLKTNDLDDYTHLLTGYVGSPTFLNKIADVVKQLKAKNPNLIYVCDPVMGDNGKMYVPQELLPIYKEVIVPLADILTPNQYEVELLTGRKINSIEDAWAAIEALHRSGSGTICLSSSELGDENHLLALASTNSARENVKLTIEIPRLPANFTGTGDLFSSLLLGWTHKTNNDLKLSLERTIATIQSVLKRTLAYATEKGLSPRNLELKLIQSKHDIETPETRIYAKPS